MEMIIMTDRSLHTGPWMIPRAEPWTAEQGWTLIELAVVLAVTGLLASLAWPSFDGLASRLTLRSTSMTVIQTLRTARHRAMTEGRAYEVAFDAGRGAYRVVGGTAAVVTVLPAPVRFGATGDVLGPPSAPATPPPESGVTFRQARVRFLPDGTLSPGPGTIYLSGRSGATLAISVNISGHLRRYEWEGRQWRAM